MHLINYTILIEIVLYQILSVLSIGIVLIVIFNIKIGLFFMLGGIINIVPGWVFGKCFFKTMGVKKAKAIVKAFYCGEALKLCITAVLFAWVFQWSSVDPIPLFVGFVVAQFAYWFVLMRLR